MTGQLVDMGNPEVVTGGYVLVATAGLHNIFWQRVV